MSSIITEGGQYPDPRSLEIQTHWLKTEYPNMTMAPFVKINYDFRDIHADFDVHLDDRIEHPSRERALIFDVCGVIVHIDPEYIILFVPIPKIWKKTFRKSPFVSAGHEVCLGQWMKVAAVQRSPPRDGLPDDEPKYSHICYDARNLRHFDAAFHLPQWEHRFVNGVFQVKMVIPLTTRGAFKKQHDEHGNIYWIADSGILQALIPCHRLAAIREGNWRGSVLIFWVNRGRVIGDYCIHLFEREHIEEHKIDGTVLLHVSPFQYPEEFNRVQTNADFVIVNPEMAQESNDPVEKEEASVDADNNLVDDSTASYRSPSPEEIPLEFLTLANEKPWNDEDSRDAHAFEQQVANEFEFLDRNPSSPNPLIEVAREQGQPGQNAQSYRIQPSPNVSKADIDEFLQSYIDPDIQALLPDNYPRMTLCSLLFELFNPRTMDVIIAEDFERELHQIADFLNEHHSSTSNNKSITGGDDAASEVFVPYA